MSEEMNEFRERMAHVETLVGEDPKSGLRGEVNDLHEKFDRVLEKMNRLDVRMALIVGGIMVISRVAEFMLVK